MYTHDRFFLYMTRNRMALCRYGRECKNRKCRFQHPPLELVLRPPGLQHPSAPQAAAPAPYFAATPPVLRPPAPPPILRPPAPPSVSCPPRGNDHQAVITELIRVAEEFTAEIVRLKRRVSALEGANRQRKKKNRRCRENSPPRKRRRSRSPPPRQRGAKTAE